MSKPRISPIGKGFTVVELLVAMAVFSLMVVALINIAGHAGSIWKAGEGQNQRRSNGRALLQNLTRELQLAALPVDLPARQNGTATANLQLVANLPANPGNATRIPSEALNPHALFWQAPVARNDSAGDLAAVGYFVKWDTSGDRPQARLCRYFVDPLDTANYLVYRNDGGVPANWLSNLNTVAPASNTNFQGWFADNVIALFVRCLDDQGRPITQTAAGTTLAGGLGFDSRQGFRDADGNIHRGPALPAAIEVAIVTLDQNTASRLTTAIPAPTATPGNFTKDIEDFVASLPPPIKTGAQVFSTIVYLQNYRP